MCDPIQDMDVDNEERDQEVRVSSSLSAVTLSSKACGGACATRMDERPVLFELNGRNEVPHVKMWGWTNNIPMEFPNLKENLCMKTVIYPDGKGNRLPADLEQRQQLADSLVRLSRNVQSRDYLPLNIPVIVQVVAKKKPVAIVLQPKDHQRQIVEEAPGQVFVMASLVVADTTGSCILTLPNESVQIIYDKVEVGDHLILDKATCRRMDEYTKAKFCYPFQDCMVGIEIKVEKYSARKLTHIPFRRQPYWKPMLPEVLFGGAQTNKDNGEDVTKAMLWTPKDIITRQKPPGLAYLDIIGVVNYVGRLERNEVYRKKVNYMDEDQDVLKAGEQRFFWAYRWVTLIDKENEKPIPLKLIVTKNCINVQNCIVPGAILVITNCRVEDNRSEFNISTSVCSQIYLSNDLGTYFKLMPVQYVETATSEILSLESYTAILNRDVDWGAGGSFNVGIWDAETFLTQYNEWKEKDVAERGSYLKNCVPDNYVFVRRERLVLTIRGRIVLVQEVLEKQSRYHMPRFKDRKCMITPNLIVYGDVDSYVEMKSIGQHMSHPIPCLCKKCNLKYWFHFPRKLTMRIPSDMTRTRDLCKAVTGSMKEICGPLLMPAVYPAGPNSQLPKLAKQPLLKSFDHYRISIRDEDTGACYETIWTTYPMKEMRRRYNEVLGKVIIAEISIFNAEADTKNEVILRDFVLEPTEQSIFEVST